MTSASLRMPRKNSSSHGSAGTHETEYMAIHEQRLALIRAYNIWYIVGHAMALAFYWLLLYLSLRLASRPLLIAAGVTASAVVWFAYPKGTSKKYTSEIGWDTGNGALGEAGFEPVRMVAIDEDWTGKRFRRVAFIKNLTRDPRALASKEGKKRVAR